MEPRWIEAEWIAEELGESQEDIYDVLLGNITEPRDFVADVERLSQEYQYKKSRRQLAKDDIRLSLSAVSRIIHGDDSIMPVTITNRIRKLSLQEPFV